MMTDQYVLPSLIPDDEDLDAGKMLEQLRKRSSSTSQIDSTANFAAAIRLRHNYNVVPSARVSSRARSSRTRSSRSGSQSSKPPSSFRVFTADSDTTSNSSHAFSTPSIRKRTSSLTLDAKLRSNHHHNHKALPSTPISATPSLTYSHSRTTSRSDEDAFASSSSSSRYSPEYRRHAILDYTHSLDALNQFEEEYAELETGKMYGSLRSDGAIKENDNFLSMTDDANNSDVALRPKKKTVAFKSKTQRYPDKATQILGEEYREGNKKVAVQGHLGSQSTISLISPSKAGFKALFSTMRGRGKREEVESFDFDESSGDTQRQIEEKQENKRKETQAKVSNLATEFSALRHRASRKERSQVPTRFGTLDKGKGREENSSEIANPQVQQSTVNDQQIKTLRKQTSANTSTLASSIRQIQLDRRDSMSRIEDSNSSPLQERASKGTHTRESSGTSSGQREMTGQESFLPISKPMKKSQSIDALYAMLQPCLEQQERERSAQKGDTSSPVIEWPQMRRENSQPRRKLQNLTQSTESKATSITDTRILPNATSLLQAGSDVDLLPPLTSNLAQCLSLDRKEKMYPWKGDREKTRLLTSSSPRDAVPKSWSAYVRAYAKGDLDLSNPPTPRSAPLVNKAIPRSSPMMDTFSPVMLSGPGSSWSASPNGTHIRLASKESLQSLNIFYDLPGSYSSNNLLPLTPPGQSTTLRDRLPSPLFPSIRKSRSRETSFENMKLPRENEEEIRIQAEELAAVGGMGDIKGPRPTWEAERSASARNYLHDHYHQPSTELQAIVEKLSDKINVSYASVQILIADESIILASNGLNEEARATFSTSPQIDCILLRDETLDAHTILQRDGAPLVITDLSKDWRFENRKFTILPFYAGVSLFANDTGLPIGTVSVMHHQAKEVTREEREVLIETAREVEKELQQMQSKALEQKLQQLDRGILGWVASVQRPAITHRAIKKAPSYSSASILASMDTSSLISAQSSEAVLSSRLCSALQTMLSALQVEFAYIARVGSDPLQCKIQARQEIGVYRAGEMKLDPSLHLCALAAHHHGLHFDNDQAKVRQLMGEKLIEEDEAAGIPHFTSARVVGCGLKEGGKAHRGTEGWVLGVASRSNGRLDAASGVYLMKFAALLASLLLQGPPPRSTDWQIRKDDENLIKASPFNKTASPRRSRRRIPLASPPPGAPLPLPPVLVAPSISTRRTIVANTVINQDSDTALNKRPNWPRKIGGLRLDTAPPF